MSILSRPIPQVLEKIANILTFGNYQKAKLSKNIDKYRHLYIVMDIDCNGTQKKILLEKNELVNVRYGLKNRVPEEKEEPVRKIQPNLTVKQFIENGEKWATDHQKQLYIYDVVTANCQRYIEWMLRGNKIYTPLIGKFILQDLENVLPTWLHFLTRKSTNLAARINILLHGRGGRGAKSTVKRRRKRKRPATFSRDETIRMIYRNLLNKRKNSTY
jgi:hypothetical protein